MIFKEASVRYPLYVTTLDNGVTLQVYGENAEGDDGKVYRHVGEEHNGVIYTVGWECAESSADK